jgi:hypothetical protein
VSPLARTAGIGLGAGVVLALVAGALYLWGTRGPAILLELYNYLCA